MKMSYLLLLRSTAIALMLFNINGAYAQCSADAGSDTLICPGGTAMLGGTPAATGNGILQYMWFPATGLSCATCPNPSASPLSSTTYTLSILDEDSCVSTSEVTVTVSGLPDAGFTFLPNNVCADTPIQFAADDNTFGYTYSWNFGNPASGPNNTSNQVNPGHEFIATGSSTQSFTVTLTVANAMGCQSNSSEVVTLGQVPDAVLIDPIADFRNCDGTTFNMTVYDATPTGPNTNYQIIWGDGSADYNAPTFPGAGIPHTYVTADIFDLVYIVTGANGCIDTLLQTVSNITNPAIGAANPGATTGCGPLTLCFPLSNYATNHPSTIYIVDYGDNSPIDTLPHPPPAEICHDYSESSCGQAGNAFTFSIQAENLCDNSLATISPIRVYTGPQAAFYANPVPGCVNTPITFFNTSTLGFNSSCQATTIFSWNFGDGTTLNQFTLANPTHSYSTPGTYTVTLSAQNGCGTTTYTQNICIEEPPVPAFAIAPDSACVPFIATVVNSSDTLNSCNITYNWNVIFNGSTCLPSSGTWSFVNGTDANDWEPQIQFSAAGEYRVRLTISNSCGTYFVENIVIAQQPPQLALPALGPICAGESINPVPSINDCYELTDTYNWDFAGGVPSSSTDELPGSIQYDLPGNYDITLEVENACGFVSATVPLVVNAPPIADAGSDVAFCSGESASIGASPIGGVNYSWTPTTGISNASVSNPTVSGTNAGVSPTLQEYVLTASTSVTCFSTDTVLVTINPIPILAVNNPVICFGELAILNVSGAGVGAIYEWGNNPDLSCTFCDNPNASPAVTTMYPVVGTNQYGCQSTTNSTVTVNPLPLVDAGPDQDFCDQPIPVNLAGSPVGGTWSGSPNITPSGVFTPNGAETVVLTYSYTDPISACSNTDQLTVVVNPAIVPVINLLDSLCLNSGVTDLGTFLNAVPSGGTFTGTGINAGNFDPITAGVGPHEVVYTLGTGTCESSDTAEIIVNQIPVLVANDELICLGDTAELLVNGAGVGGTYSWTPNVNLSCTDCGDPFAWPVATTTYSVNGVNVHGCTASLAVTVTVDPLPVVNGGPDQLLCDQPVPVVLNGVPGGGSWSGSPNLSSGGIFIPNGNEDVLVVYAYTDPITGCSNTDTVHLIVSPPVTPTVDPVSGVCFANPALDLNVFLNVSPTGGTWSGTGVITPNFSPTTAGVGIHTLTYTYGSGTCQTQVTSEITVNPQPILNVSDETICFGDTVGLLVSGAGIGGTYSWNPSSGLSCDDCEAPEANPSTTTTYSVQGVNSFNCASTENVTVTVVPLPIVNAGPDQVLCDQPISVVLNGAPGGGMWSGSSNLLSNGTFTPNGIEEVDVVYEYTDMLTGCTNTDSVHISVTAPVTPTFNQGQEICFENAVVDLNAFLNPSPNGGSWSGNGVLGSNFNPNSAGAGVHALDYTIGVGTCETTTPVDITVNPQPLITVNDGTICNGESAPLFADGAGIGGQYVWSPATALSCANCQNPNASPGTTTSYVVTGINQFGCSNTAISTVTVNPLPIVNAGNDTSLCNLPAPVQFTGIQSGGNWSGPMMAPNGVFTPGGTGSFTVTYTVVLGTGCTDSDEMVITVVDPALANAGSDLEECIQSGTVGLTGLPGGGSWTGSNVSSVGVFDLGQDGTFELVYTTGTGNCLTRDTMLFVVHPLPLVQAGPDEALCISEPVFTHTGNPTGGNWTGTGITDPLTGAFDPQVAGSGTHTVTYTYSDPITSCINTDQLTIQVHPLPVVGFTVDPVVCVGQQVVFTNTSTLIDNVDWDFGDNSGSTTINPAHTYASVGFYNVQLIVTTAFGCQDSLTLTIEVREPPVADFTVTPDSLCGPLNASFTNLSSGIQTTYLWDLGNGQSSTAEDPANVLYPAGQVSDTSYTITLSVTNFCGTVAHQEDIVVMPEPTALFGTDFNTGCSPWTVNIANTSYGLPDTYYWEFGDGTTSTTDDDLFTHVFTTGATPTDYTIMLVVANECGEDTSYHTVTVLPNAVDAFFNTSVTEGCEDLTIDFTQYTLGGTTYSWDFGDGNTSTTYSPSHTFSNPGTYTVALMANDGCSFDTTEVLITVHPSPVITFTFAPDSVCINVPFLFTNTSGLLANSQWDFGDGNTSNLTNPTHSYATSGNYVVTLTGTAMSNGCEASISQTVPVSVNPVAAFTAVPLSGCVPLTVQFTNQSTNATYSQWDFGDGNTSGLLNPQHTFVQAGVYPVMLIVENSNGCTDTISQNITVHPLPVANFTYNSTSTCYTPSDFVFINQSSGAVNYNWDFGNGQQSSLVNPQTSYTNPGTYTIQLTATNQYGCLATTSQQVTIYETPVAAFNLPDDVVCENDSLLFESNSNFADSIVWQFGDGSELTGESVYYSFPGSGTYNVTIMVYGAGGCGDTLTLATPITVHPEPIANFSYVNVQIPDPVSGTVEFTNLSQQATTYFWDFGNGVSSDEMDPIHRYNTYGDFYVMLIASNNFGCADTVYEWIEIDFFNGLYIPNAMYPDHADFEVSHFVPKGVGLKDFLIQIYDDWGNLIWESNALDPDGRPTEAWDGTYQGQPVQQDAYVWKVTAKFMDESIWEGKEYDDGILKRAGTVTVIR